MTKQETWDRHFLALALQHARMSKDPNTQVGCFVVGPDREVLSAGFNGFPRGIADDSRLHHKETKLKLIVHAEMNAVLAAARLGIRLRGATIYVACTDRSGAVWGGPPCTRCTVELIQVGISRVVAYPQKKVSSWTEDLNLARSLLQTTGIKYEDLMP